jgi:ankyrin repeat protein
MIFKQDLLFCFLLIDAGVGFPEAIIPMMNIDNLNNIISNNGDTILNCACKLHSLKAVQALIAGGVDLNKANKENITPLQIACELGRLEIAQALIDAGADLNKVSIKGDTPLHIACKKNYLEVAQALIIAGAELNIVNNEGETPLEIAKKNNNHKIIQVLELKINKTPESDTQKRPKGEGLATPLERDPKRHKPGDGPAGGVGI